MKKSKKILEMQKRINKLQEDYKDIADISIKINYITQSKSSTKSEEKQ